MASDDDRIAYLVGDGLGPFGVIERSDLDDLRGMLSDPALWAEPDEHLESAVVAAIAAHTTVPAPPAAPPAPSASSQQGDDSPKPRRS